HSRALPTELRPRYIGPRKTRSGGNTASYLDVLAVSSVFPPSRELFDLCPVSPGDPGLIAMPKHIRRKKTTSPARAKPRGAARPVAVAAVAPARPPVPQAKAKPAKKRGRRRGLLSGLGTHEHARQGRTVRVPLNRTADLSRIVRTAEFLRQTLRREPTPEEISDATKLSLEVVQSLAALNTGDVRLDAPLDPDGDRSLIERFIAEDLPDTEDQAMDRFLSDEIEQALNTLQRRDAKVLRLYFG